MRSFPARTLLVFALLLCSSTSCLAKVEAIKGKRYRLSSQHGPWMIMVAALKDVPEGRRIEGGMTAWEAADELVYELRTLGIPAYAYLQQMKVQKVNPIPGAGKGVRAKYIAQNEAIAVLAGNFSSPDLKQAQLILDYLKNSFEPRFLKEKNNGAILPRTPGRPNPLNRAHLTTNPLMSQANVQKNTLDPLVRKLNSGAEYSLLKNKAKYSLRVATFKGTSILQVGNKVQEKAESQFDKMFGDNLDAAGKSAWELTQALRSARRLGYDRDYEAWVFHDRYESYVTIGSFDSKSDPRLAQLAKQFGGKRRTLRGNEVFYGGAQMEQGDEALTAESFSIPRNVPMGRDPQKFWMFDLTPKLIEIPRIRR